MESRWVKISGDRFFLNAETRNETDGTRMAITQLQWWNKRYGKDHLCHFSLLMSCFEGRQMEIDFEFPWDDAMKMDRTFSYRWQNAIEASIDHENPLIGFRFDRIWVLMTIRTRLWFCFPWNESEGRNRFHFKSVSVCFLSEADFCCCCCFFFCDLLFSLFFFYFGF